MPNTRILKALVTPGPDLTSQQVTQFSRHIVIPGFGTESQRRLLNARVAVIGAGGLGSPILLYLAAAGVGTIGIIDDDVVEPSNLQRQVIHESDDVGRLKGESARDAVLARNPDATVVLHPVRLSSENALDIVKDYDLLIDGSDNFATRYLASDTAEILRIPCVWGSILRYSGQASTFWSRPNDGQPGVTYRDLFPEPPSAGSVPDCAEGGVLGVLCSMIGTMMATDAIKLITGIGTSMLGRLISFDAEQMTWRELRVSADPLRAPITQLDDYDAVGGVLPAASASDSPEWDATQLAQQLAARKLGASSFRLIDIRENFERELCLIEGSEHIPMNNLLMGAADPAIDADETIVLYCHHGSRSDYTMHMLAGAGYENVHHLAGGIDAWSLSVDPEVARY